MSLLCLLLLLLAVSFSVSGDDGNGLPDDAAVNKIEYNVSPDSEIQQMIDFYSAYLPARGSRNKTQGEGSSGGRARQLGGMGNVDLGMGGVWPGSGALLAPGGQMSLDPGGQLTGMLPVGLNSGVSADLTGIADSGPQFRGGGGYGGGFGGGFGGYGGFYGPPFYPPFAPPFFYGAVPVPIG